MLPGEWGISSRGSGTDSKRQGGLRGMLGSSDGNEARGAYHGGGNVDILVQDI